MRGLLSRVGEPHRVATPGVAKYLIGEVAERSKALDWNSSNISTGVRGFESHPLRHLNMSTPRRSCAPEKVCAVPVIASNASIMVARIGFSATTSRESRQGRKAAAAAAMSGAGAQAGAGRLPH